MSLSPGTSLGTHEIVGLLGAGGMGEVYRARDTKLNRQVAIKVLPDAYASDPDRVARFHREAQAIAALNHPNIAAIYDLAESGPTKYLVLELIEGDTLADRLRRGPVSPEEALLIIKQVLEALEVAHERGICHRDLKPANIKLTGDGVVKVLDFGLAKFMQPGGSAPNVTNSPTLSVAGTIPGVILGTAGYMSPEQAKGYDADQRSDIFSVGCILYELLSGRQAFEGETASEILAGVLKSEVDFSALPPRLNPRLIELLRRCLEKNPKKRWHAAADVRVEVESLFGRATTVHTATVETGPRWRRAAIVAVAVAAGAAIAGPAAWMLKPAPEPLPARFTVPLPQGQLFTGSGRNLVTISPDGAHIVYTAANRLFLRSLGDAQLREIAGSYLGGGVALNPVFSPDGESIAFWSQSDSTLKRLPRTGGVPVTLSKITAPYGMSWDEHGIVFGQLQQGIMRLPPDGGAPELIAKAAAGEVLSQPSMLPDGRAVMFAVRQESQDWETGSIVVQELGGQRTLVLHGGADPRALPTGHLAFARSGEIHAVRFNQSTRKTVGQPVSLVEGVRRGAAAPTGPQTGVAHYAYSKTGTLVYLPGPRAIGDSALGYDLAVFDSRGGIRLLGLPRRPHRSPRVSRDGKFLAFDIEDQKEASIWVHELAEGRTPQRLTFEGRNRYPVWSADGRSLFFQSNREGDRAIFRQLADGTGRAERLTTASSNVEHAPLSASPDGMHLLFASTDGAKWNLSILSLSDRRVSQFGGVESIERTDGAFSPDGKWVAYQYRETGKARQVFVQPFPATGAKYYVTDGGHPYWSAKGDAIIVNTAPSRSDQFSFAPTPRVTIGKPQNLIRAGRLESNPVVSPRAADSMPDGSGILGIAIDGGPASNEAQLNVVLNWFADVRQRLPRQ